MLFISIIFSSGNAGSFSGRFYHLNYFHAEGPNIICIIVTHARLVDDGRRDAHTINSDEPAIFRDLLDYT